MPPLAASRRNRAPLSATRIRFLAAAGLLVATIIGALCFHGERPASVAESLPPPARSSTPAPAQASLHPLTAQSLSTAQVTARAAEETPWPEEEKERIRGWAQSAPREAAGWATALSAGDNRRFALETAALAWGDRDPASAAQWARGLPDQAERALALTDIADEAVRSDPILALELARSLPDAIRSEIVPRATREWATQDPAAAADWARRISGESLRATVLAGIATVWSDQDPVKGATLAVKELPAGRLQADAVVSIVQRWVQQSPAVAADWVQQFPDGDLRDAAIENLGKHATALP